MGTFRDICLFGIGRWVLTTHRAKNIGGASPAGLVLLVPHTVGKSDVYGVYASRSLMPHKNVFRLMASKKRPPDPLISHVETPKRVKRAGNVAYRLCLCDDSDECYKLMEQLYPLGSGKCG